MPLFLYTNYLINDIVNVDLIKTYLWYRKGDEMIDILVVYLLYRLGKFMYEKVLGDD